jgi:hypothetical protein
MVQATNVERTILMGIIEDFNASQSDYVVSLEEFPKPATTNRSLLLP